MSDSRERFEATTFEGFKRYMDAPCHELHELDAGRNDPHRLMFEEWGVPHEVLLWLWQAAERDALERAAAFMEKRSSEFEMSKSHIGWTMARIYREEAAAIRDLARKE